LCLRDFLSYVSREKEELLLDLMQKIFNIRNSGVRDLFCAQGYEPPVR
jgi:hypothetical protein